MAEIIKSVVSFEEVADRMLVRGYKIATNEREIKLWVAAPASEKPGYDWDCGWYVPVSNMYSWPLGQEEKLLTGREIAKCFLDEPGNDLRADYAPSQIFTYEFWLCGSPIPVTFVAWSGPGLEFDVWAGINAQTKQISNPFEDKVLDLAGRLGVASYSELEDNREILEALVREAPDA